MTKRHVAAPALFLLFAGPVQAQRVETGFLDRTVTLAGQSYRYQVYVPADYPTKATWPLILFLHGAGERGADGLLQTTVGLGPAIRRDAKRFLALVVFPQAPLDSQWVGMPAEMALAALAQTMLEFHVDRDRVYLTGLSMGGHATWCLAYRHLELFAAVVPICGWVPDPPLCFSIVRCRAHVSARHTRPLQNLAERSLDPSVTCSPRATASAVPTFCAYFPYAE